MFWATLAVVGLVPVLYCAVLLAWQTTALFQGGSWIALPAKLLFTEHPYWFIPTLPWTWLSSPDSLLPAHSAVVWVLSRLHAGSIFAVVGLSLVAIGIIGTLRHYAVIRALRQRSEDRRRRVHDYRSDEGKAALDGRREPFISQPRNPRTAVGGAR